jgi:CDP-glycerol glycerophosphotransferase
MLKKIFKPFRQSEAFKIFLFYFFRLFPIQKNKIVFCNFSGKRCGDSPRSISDYLQNKHPDLDIVWLCHPEYNPEIPKGTRKVAFGMCSFKMIYELATAQVWVDSHTKFAFTRKRKNQFYMETWHGGIGLKKVEGDVKESLDAAYMKRVHVNSNLIDVFLSNSQWASELYKRAFFYKGTLLESGLPRNDIFFKNQNVNEIHKYYKLAPHINILLYAPTFRADDSVECYNIDTKKILEVLENKTSEKWVILVRLHPMAMKLKHKIEFNSSVIDATNYPDMQKLLLEASALVSDYSSCMFDYALLKRPCFIFANDILAYKNDRDFYFDLKDLPFSVAENNDELETNILKFNQKQFENDLVKFFKNVGLKENGNATEIASKQIETWMNL